MHTNYMNTLIQFTTFISLVTQQDIQCTSIILYAVKKKAVYSKKQVVVKKQVIVKGGYSNKSDNRRPSEITIEDIECWLWRMWYLKDHPWISIKIFYFMSVRSVMDYQRNVTNVERNSEKSGKICSPNRKSAFWIAACKLPSSQTCLTMVPAWIRFLKNRKRGLYSFLSSCKVNYRKFFLVWFRRHNSMAMDGFTWGIWSSVWSVWFCRDWLRAHLPIYSTPCQRDLLSHTIST